MLHPFLATQLRSAAFGGNDPNDSLADTDHDGLDDYAEIQRGTDPTQADRDHDGLNDYQELQAGTDPYSPDTDNDGLLDGEEVYHYDATLQQWVGGWDIVYAFDAQNQPLITHVTSNPLNPDTDGDGITDKLEYIYGFNPRVASPLNVLDFVHIVSLIALDPATTQKIAPVAAVIALAEGLDLLGRKVLGNQGATLNPTATTFSLGDDKTKKQYRGILSFNTKLPAGAKITGITLQIKTSSTLAVANSMFKGFGNILVDIKKGNFGLVGLEITDFQAAPSLKLAGKILNTPVAGVYSSTLSSAAIPFINAAGTTQFRLRFAKDDNDDLSADYIKFFSGNAVNPANWPTLVIEYIIP